MMLSCAKVTTIVGVVAIACFSVDMKAAVPLRAGPLLQPANYFDLEGKQLTFRPSGSGYQTFLDAAPPIGANRGTQLTTGLVGASTRIPGWRVAVPFDIPFGGTNWREFFVNISGTVTFGDAEANWYTTSRNTWADGTMTSVATQLQQRSLGGPERLIAVLWSLNMPSAPQSRAWVLTEAATRTTLITWEVGRRFTENEGYTPLGVSLYQLRLSADGEIRMTWFQAPEKDGIVGVFSGQPPAVGDKVDEFADPADVAAAPRMDVRRVVVHDAGPMIRFTLTLEGEPLERTPEGTIFYRLYLYRGSGTAAACEFGLRITATARAPYSGCSLPLVKIEGSTIEIYQSKAVAPGEGPIRWAANTAWFERAAGTLSDAVVAAPGRALNGLPEPVPTDLSSLSSAGGTVFELFRYPLLSKSQPTNAQYVYSQVEAEDHLALMFTDFRIDDLHNHGTSASPINGPISGIGRIPRDGRDYGSSSIQAFINPVFAGGPRFAESGVSSGIPWRNYAQAVGWTAHELVHRWSSSLRAQLPGFTDLDQLISKDGCFCHWSLSLNAPVRFKVSSLFSDRDYPERTLMSGADLFTENANGTFTRVVPPGSLPHGFSDLDLYVAGFLRPEEVKETFLIDNPVNGANNLVTGRRVGVSIDHVLAAAGPRIPSSDEAQKEFNLSVYLLTEEGRDVDPKWLAHVEGIEKSLTKYFEVATGGVMKVKPTAVRSKAKPASLKVISANSTSVVVEVRGAAGEVLSGVKVTATPLAGSPVKLESGEAVTTPLGQATILYVVTSSELGAAITVTVEGLEPLLVMIPSEDTGTRRQLVSGTEVAFSYPAVSSPTLLGDALGFRINVPANSSRLVIELNGDSISGDIDLHASYGATPFVVDGRVNADHNSVGDAGAERIEINNMSVPPLRAGTYFISFTAYTTGVPIRGTIKATVSPQP
jgi:hypothetical protein